jgi:ABC-type branched-subunit amino acid transport system substrate-binding protein
VSRGAKAYFKTVNAHGGVNGYRFQFDLKDNAYKPAQSVSVTRQLANSGAFEVIEAGTPPVQAVAAVSDQLQLPIFGTANGDIVTPGSKYKYMFGINAQYSRLAKHDAQFIMNRLHTKRFALVYQSGAFDKSAKQVVPTYVRNQGGTLLVAVPVEASATDFTATAARLKRSGAKVVQALVGTSGFAGLQKAADAIGYHPTWVTIFTQMTPSYSKLVGPLSDGVYADDFLLNGGKAQKEFASGIEQYYPDLKTDQLAQQGWSAGALTVDAIKRATKNGGELTTKSYLKALEGFDGKRVGLIASVKFGPKSHAAPRQVAMYRYDGSTPKAVTDYETLPTVPSS